MNTSTMPLTALCDYELRFQSLFHEGRALAFPCDSEGHVDLDALSGPPVSLASLRGRPLLLNFWASWCEPCRAEMPSLELLESRHASAGLKVLAINFRETDGTVKRFVEQTGLSLTVLRDRDGGTARDYGVKIYPTTIAVDRAGRARFSVTGEVDWLGPDAARWLRPSRGSSPISIRSP